MSRLQVGKLSLQCSMDVLTKAIKNIITAKCSECAKYIKTSEKTDLEIHSIYLVYMDDNPGKFNIVISKEAGISYSDIGIKQESNNSWTFKSDDHRIHSFQKQIIQEVFAMRARAIAEMKNLEIIKDTMEGTDKVIRIRKKIEN